MTSSGAERAGDQQSEFDSAVGESMRIAMPVLLPLRN